MKRTTLAGLLLLASGAAATARPATNDNTMKDTTEFHQIFPQGEANPPANAQYFIGQSYLAPLTRNGALNCPVYNVTFEPGCRNNWHSHTGGQLLLVTAGRGFYQERGQEARQLLPGDVVEIAPNVVHWHGAAPRQLVLASGRGVQPGHEPQHMARARGRRRLPCGHGPEAVAG